MDPVGAGGIERTHLLAELGEIGGQDRRCDDERWSISLSQLILLAFLLISLGLTISPSILRVEFLSFARSVPF
jgi:hypothetical protein